MLNGGDSLPTPNEPAQLGRQYDALPAAGAGDPPRDPDPLRHRRGPRPQRRARRGDLPAQHRPRLHARSRRWSRRSARVTAREVAGAGVDWTFAPCIAVPRDERWGRTYEGFGETPELAATLGPAAVRGLQNAGRRQRRARLRQALPRRRRHRRRQGPGRRADLRGGAARASTCPATPPPSSAGVGSVMVSYSSWNGAADARQPAPHHRRAQGRARLHRASSSPTGRRSNKLPGRLRAAGRGARSTPASTW